jgi:hypothetical protein
MSDFDQLRIELVNDDGDRVVFKDDEIQAFEHDNKEIKLHLSRAANRGISQTFDADQLVSIEIRRS